MGRLYICGGGNPEGVRLALRVNAAQHRWDDIVLLDDNPSLAGTLQMGVPVVGGFGLLADANPARDSVVNMIARTTQRRRAARDRIAAFGVPFTGLISADVDLLGADVAHDLVAYQHATIGPEAVLGTGCVVFMSATVGHECQVGNDCVIAASSVLNARVRLGDGAYVGSNASILPEVSVGAHATVGAGAVVVSDVPDGATVFGRIGDVVSAHSATAAPTTAAERRPRTGTDAALGVALRRLWCEALGLERIDPSRNFFEQGGTSLIALQLSQRIQAETGRTVCAVDLFHHPTLDALQVHLEADPVEEARAALRGAGDRAALRRARQAFSPR